jgi:uncharacterized membrane protein
MGYLIYLRLIHIVSAVIWTGGMIYFAFFVIPAAKSIGPDGFKFIQQLTITNKLPVIMNAAAILSILTGIILMKELLGGLSLSLMQSPHGAIIVVGGLLALIGFVLGFSINFPAAKRMNAIGKMIATPGSPPNAELLNELQQLRNKSLAATNIIALLLFASLILMSIVKYI